MIGNLDEMMLSSNSKLVCVGKRGSRFAVSEGDDSAEHVTMLACVTTDGRSMPPFIIFPLTNLPNYSRPTGEKQAGIYIGGQEKGWIDQGTFFEHAKLLVNFVKGHRHHHGLPEDEPFLLFDESHNSREKPETMKLLKENNVTPSEKHFLPTI